MHRTFVDCIEGYYGKNCNKMCSNCNSSAPSCNKDSGTCFFGCNDGWESPSCAGLYNIKCLIILLNFIFNKNSMELQSRSVIFSQSISTKNINKLCNKYIFILHIKLHLRFFKKWKLDSCSRIFLKRVFKVSKVVFFITSTLRKH